MGQAVCCEAKGGSDDLIATISSLQMRELPEARPPALHTSTDRSLLCRQGFREGDDGDFICEDPLVTEAVFQRMQALAPIEFPESLRFSRGSEVRGSFRLRRTGIIYAGEWRVHCSRMQNKAPNGYGKNYYPNGGMYEGSFLDGVPHGYGRFIMPGGDFYEGEVRFGRASGLGTYESDECVYRGGFKDNVKHGEGEEKGRGFLFRGLFEYGERKSGLFKFNGNLYEGSFVDSLFSGKAKLTTSEGQYLGEFKDGKQNGYGEFQWPDGSVYRGYYYHGRREGLGEYYNGKNCSLSKGMWKGGVLHGEGSYTEPHGETFKCVWAEGKIAAIVDK